MNCQECDSDIISTRNYDQEGNIIYFKYCQNIECVTHSNGYEKESYVDDRERDIQELCRQVLLASPNVQIGRNSESSSCPFCSVQIEYEEDEISKLRHKQYCAYLIAKDLSTNF